MKLIARSFGSLPLALILCAACGDSAGAGGAGGGSSSTSTSTSTGQSSSTHGATTTSVSGATVSGSTATGGTSDTWTNFGQQFFATYCVECHGAGNAMRDYTTLAGVNANAAEVRCGTAPVLEPTCSGFPPPNQFPIPNGTNSNPKPSAADRARVVAWIDAGLPN